MEKYPIKYCRYCGKELVEDNGKLTCPNFDDKHLLELPNDKLGVITYLINLLGNKLKGKLLNDAYRASKLFFITKLLSYVLVVTVVAGTAATTVGVVNKTKNDTLLKTGEMPKEAAPIKTYEYTVTVEEPEFSEDIEEIQEEPTIFESIQNTIEDIKNEIASGTQESNSNVEEQEIEEPMQFGTDIVDKVPQYTAVIKGEVSGDDFYANGPLTSGAYMDAVLNGEGIEDADIGTIIYGNELYLYYDNGEPGPEGDNIFAKLTFIEVNGDYKLVSDESVSMSFDEYVETHPNW